MFQEHRCFSPPPDDTAVLRYIDLARLVSLLEMRALWFAVPSTLDDPWEGFYPNAHYDERIVAESILAESSDQSPKSEVDASRFAGLHVISTKLTARYRDASAISCWHAGHYESDALWKLYATSGVAICSTVARLKASLMHFPDNVYIGAIRYLDHRHQEQPTDNLYWRLLWKRMAYAHEHEVRAVVSMGASVFEELQKRLPGMSPAGPLAPLPTGRYVSILLDELIASIRVAPLAPDWLVNAVAGLARRYGLSCEVSRSELSAMPPSI